MYKPILDIEWVPDDSAEGVEIVWVDPKEVERKLLNCGPCGLPDCCTYHNTGGFRFVKCKTDPYEPAIHEDSPEPDGTLRDGIKGFKGGMVP